MPRSREHDYIVHRHVSEVTFDLVQRPVLNNDTPIGDYKRRLISPTVLLSSIEVS